MVNGKPQAATVVEEQDRHHRSEHKQNCEEPLIKPDRGSEVDQHRGNQQRLSRDDVYVDRSREVTLFAFEHEAANPAVMLHSEDCPIQRNPQIVVHR